MSKAEYYRNYNKEYVRSKRGLITKMYNRQSERTKKHGFDKINYTKQEFFKWVLSRDNFETLYANWEKSNYQTLFKPSIDRLDDYKGYSFSNIRLVTWGENDLKGKKDRRNGVNNKWSKTVLQLDLSGNIINEYFSIMESSRQTNINRGNISNVCTGRAKTAGGYKWQYK